MIMCTWDCGHAPCVFTLQSGRQDHHCHLSQAPQALVIWPPAQVIPGVGQLILQLAQMAMCLTRHMRGPEASGQAIFTETGHYLR